MTYAGDDAWWWPFFFVLVAGCLATYAWRFLGVYLGGRLDENAEILVLVRAVATALVAAVIGNLVVFPSGPLADAPLLLRVGAAACGFLVYIRVRRSVLLSIVVAEAVLVAGLLVLPATG